MITELVKEILDFLILITEVYPTALAPRKSI